ncbi:hypothetical protein JQC65_10980 [Escherichia coli]|uniref:hypothetical protein n=2 Tax=Enterobacteriaceae TaxID=543 RepID=UPI001CBEB4D4|nr:hypothetical protein [Escherichia coli]MBZ1405080.1 hypothetical protein [Escherichia coli]
MMKGWILTFTETKECIAQSFRYPILSKNTFFVSVLTVFAFVISWLTLSGVKGDLKPAASLTIFCSYFLFVISSVSWSFRMREMHTVLVKIIVLSFITIVLLWNYLGDGLFTVIQNIVSHDPQSGVVNSEVFIALSDMISNTMIVCLWPGFYWLSLSVILLAQFRQRADITKGILKRMIINLPVWIMQVFVYVSLCIVLLIISPLTQLPVMITPLLTVWNSVFIFLVIVNIENGTPPATVIGQIARVRLTLRK